MKNKLLTLGLGTWLLGGGLAHALDLDRDRDHDGKRDRAPLERGPDRDKDQDKAERRAVPVVPETNAAWVLLPFMGLVLLYGGWRVARRQR